MSIKLIPNRSSVGVEGEFWGNFTKAKFLRSQPAAELEKRIGYGAGRLASGYWLLFALEKPDPSNFEFGGYTHFSGARIGNPRLGDERLTVEASLTAQFGGASELLKAKARHIENLQIFGHERLAKVIPVAGGNEYPVGSGIYQCNIPNAIKCKVAAFIAPGEVYSGDYR